MGQQTRKAILGLLAASFAFLVLSPPRPSPFRCTRTTAHRSDLRTRLYPCHGVVPDRRMRGALRGRIGLRRHRISSRRRYRTSPWHRWVSSFFPRSKSVPMLFAARFFKAFPGYSHERHFGLGRRRRKRKVSVVATTIAGCGALVGVSDRFNRHRRFLHRKQQLRDHVLHSGRPYDAGDTFFVLCAPEPPHARVRLRAAIRPITQNRPRHSARLPRCRNGISRGLDHRDLLSILQCHRRARLLRHGRP